MLHLAAVLMKLMVSTYTYVSTNFKIKKNEITNYIFILEDDDESDDLGDLYCVACEKDFRSDKA